jgi:hypothetical protein
MSIIVRLMPTDAEVESEGQVVLLCDEELLMSLSKSCIYGNNFRVAPRQRYRNRCRPLNTSADRTHEQVRRCKGLEYFIYGRLFFNEDFC